jgi:hypothetical protein
MTMTLNMTAYVAVHVKTQHNWEVSFIKYEYMSGDHA